MENFDNILILTEKSQKILGGIFDRENVEEKIAELESISQKKIFKDKNLVKNSQTKKFFEDILNSYKKSLEELNNLKDLYSLAVQEQDEETITDCHKKIEQILKEVKKMRLIVFCRVIMMT